MDVVDATDLEASHVRPLRDAGRGLPVLAAINKTGQRELDFLAWGEVIASQSKTQRHSAYSVQTAADSKVTSYKMKFDVHTMQFGLKQETFQLPSSGLVRSYNAATAVCRQW